MGWFDAVSGLSERGQSNLQTRRITMKILLLSSAYNSLTQQAHVWLKASHYEVVVAAATTAATMRDAVAQFQPDLILCPMLAQVIPRDIWENHTCIIIHPGIPGDRGPNSLDWAILNEEQEWGVIAVQAEEHVDSGAIWASYHFPMREGSKSSMYRDEVALAAMRAMMVAVHRYESGLFVPAPLDYSRPEVRGRYRPAVKPHQRQIDWQNDPVAEIIKKIRSADGQPGLLDDIGGEPFYLHGAHEEGTMIGVPGDIIAQRHGAICRAAVDGAVWISHLRPKGRVADGFIKLPAADVLGDLLDEVPDVAAPLHYSTPTKTYRDIWYEERNDVGYVNFRFYNGAMGTVHCQRLTEAVEYAKSRPTKVIVLSGGRDFFSNGIHLNLIEAAADPAEESWLNINAMDDLVLAVLTATDHYTIAALYGSAGAGGVMLPLAADRVFAREGIVLNPHYKGMGGLYGSEYWTYSLPKRVGEEMALQLTEQCLPISVEQAKAIGLIDDIIIQDGCCPSNFTGFQEQIVRIAEKLAHREDFDVLLEQKREARQADEKMKPLQQYRFEELEEMNQNFWGNDPAYHLARSAFVRKLPRLGTGPCSPALLSVCGNRLCDEAIQASRNRCVFSSTNWPRQQAAGR
jgi:putative two-component system hydrogenase maturation factor HypX/HoxX